MIIFHNVAVFTVGYFDQINAALVCMTSFEQLKNISSPKHFNNENN